MKIWAVANQKGGVGKTTTAISLAGLLAARGSTALLVDMDPHGSLSSYFGHDPDAVETSLYTLFQYKDAAALSKQRVAVAAGVLPPATLVRPCTSQVIRPTRFNRISVLPASSGLATLDRQLSGQDGMGLVVARALAEVQNEFDYALLDCPPMLGVLMVNALAACEHLLIPVQTEFLALKGLERMLHTLAMITRARKQPLVYTIVPTLFDRRTRAGVESLNLLRQKYRETWSGEIPVDTQFREASRAGAPLPLSNPQARGSIAYAGLLDNLLGETVVPQQVANSSC